MRRTEELDRVYDTVFWFAESIKTDVLEDRVVDPQKVSENKSLPYLLKLHTKLLGRGLFDGTFWRKEDSNGLHDQKKNPKSVSNTRVCTKYSLVWYPFMLGMVDPDESDYGKHIQKHVVDRANESIRAAVSPSECVQVRTSPYECRRIWRKQD